MKRIIQFFALFLFIFSFTFEYSAAQSSQYAYITNQDDGTISIIDLNYLQVLQQTIYVDGKPDNIVISSDGKWVYVSNLNGYISVIDVAANNIYKTLTSLYDIKGIDFSHDGQYAYVAYNVSPVKIRVYETEYHTDISDYQIVGSQTNAAILASPEGNKLYVLDDSRRIVFNVNATDGFINYQTPIGYSPKDIILSPDGQLLYVANSANNSVFIINTLNGIVIDTLYTDQNPVSLTISSEGEKLYVGHLNANSIRMFDFNLDQFIDIPTGLLTLDIALYRDTFLYIVPKNEYRTVSVFKMDEGYSVANLLVGLNPQKIAFLNPANQEGTSTLPPIDDLSITNVLSDRLTLTWTAIDGTFVNAPIYNFAHYFSLQHQQLFLFLI